MSYTHPNAACRLCAYAESMKVAHTSTDDDNKNNIHKTIIDRARPPKRYDPKRYDKSHIRRSHHNKYEDNIDNTDNINTNSNSLIKDNTFDT